MKSDQITCRGLFFECEIGFFPNEKKVKQKIEIDFTAWVKPVKKDAVRAIRLDYFKANGQICDLLSKRTFKLIETAAEEIARLLLQEFDIQAVSVSLTKRPLDMPPASSVTYQCYREK